jgi:hypothetical protein
MFETVVTTSQTIFYCATCNKEFGPDEENRIGQRFICPEGSTHIAAIVKPPAGKAWLRFEKRLLACAEASPLRYFDKTGHPGLYHLIRSGCLLGALALATPASISRSLLAVLVSMYFLFDLLTISTCATFISRNPTHPLRTLIFTISTLLQVAFVFATLYWLIGSQFSGIAGRLDAVYFSVVTISTLGYGDIHPSPDAHAAKLLVMSELMLGLYVLAGLLSVVAGWGNSLPIPRRTPLLRDLSTKPDSSPDSTPAASRP